MFCSYCGTDAPGELDHVVPWSYGRVRKRKGERPSRKSAVPCCRECNVMLGNKLLLTISERAGFIHRRLYKKYDKFLSLPEWSITELSEVEENLRKAIKEGLGVKELTEIRIDHCGYIADLAPTIPEMWELQEESPNLSRNTGQG